MDSWLRWAPRGRRVPGFSMMELLAVMAFVAILAALAMPSMMERIVRNQIVEAAQLTDIAKKPVAAAWSAAALLPLDNAAADLPSADKIVGNHVSALTELPLSARQALGRAGGLQSYFRYLKRGSSGVPSSAAPSSRPGCHITTSSILRARAKSLSVMPLAAWFCSFTLTNA
jgi:prepilin-type N-terminal cleavage/methylation domain-containing protein